MSMTHRLVIVLSLVIACAAAAQDVRPPRTMASGDTLWQLAKDAYGDPSYWTALKWYNGLGNERTIPTGTVIKFPQKTALDQVNTALKNNTSPAARNSAIAGIGGQSSPVPQAQVNAGAGRKIFYNATYSLALPASRLPQK